MSMILAVAVLLADERFVVTDELRPEPTPIVEPTPIRQRPLLELDESAVAMMAQGGTKPTRKLIVYSLASGCQPCNALKAAVGDGDGELTVEYVYSGHPAWTRSLGYPVVYDPERNLYNRTHRTLPGLREWVGLPAVKAPASTEPLMLGTANIKSLVDTAIATIEAFGGDKIELTLTHAGKGWIELGPVSVLIPTGCKPTYTSKPSRLTFGGTKPRVRIMRAIDQPINGVLYDGGKLTVDVDSWIVPDIVMDVK